ncbi:hypothetical protein PHMEG_00018920 [Phytophthora megakarya]|uniref:Uncharacterized protein n=1 Tax=Phytophthora megakarya TaxID=4795 RepID=A0A225VT59_9STRA|nr:hypothetical protein PHMEG_00018920 [Phytophthora megakarya]
MAIATLAPPHAGDGAHTSDTSGGLGSDAPAEDGGNTPPDTDGNAPDAPTDVDPPGNDNTGDSNGAGKSSPAVEKDGAEEPLNFVAAHAERVAGWTSIAESDRIGLPGIIPSSATSLSMGTPVVHVSWDVPPSFDSVAERHIVGVPANETSLQRGSRMYDGCGGLETPLLFESLSAEDLADLEGLLGRDSLDFLLQLRNYAPTTQERDTEARSSLVQREVASILAHFSSERLTERVYNTMSFLRRLLVKVRDLQDHIQRLDGDKASDHALWLQDTNHALEREWTAMSQYWHRHVQDDENIRLRTELRVAQDAQESAERRADDNVLDPDDLLDFLMRDESGVTVISNWERLRDIFRHYAEGTKVPSVCNTQINVTAMDNVRYMHPDYVKPDPQERQMCPEEHCPRDDLPCGPDEDLDSGMEAYAQKRVPDGLLWDDLRQGVRMLMITGLTYEEALKLLHGGDPIHHLLPGYMVQLMLAQMIDWGTLDLTPWDVAAEVEMINGTLSESSDDETQDPSFSLKPGAEEADNAQETRDEAEDLDDGADEKPKASSRAPDTKVIKKVMTNTGRAKGVCDRDVTSTFRVFGIKMKFSDKVQTLGFPDYEPHKHETKYLKDRWFMEAWDEFLGVVRVKKSGSINRRVTTSKRNSSEAGAYGSGSDPNAWESRVLDFVLPWVQMFEDRSKEFYFHRVRDLGKGAQRILQRLEKIHNFPKTLWYEPGLWILPNTICYWIFKDPSMNFRTVSGVADLRASQELDEREPARTLWADAASETAPLEHVPEAFVSKRLLPKIERAKNLLPVPRPSSTPKPRTTRELYELRPAQDAASAGSNSD